MASAFLSQYASHPANRNLSVSGCPYSSRLVCRFLAPWVSAMMLLLAGLGAWLQLSWPFWLAYLIVCGLLVWEHRLVRPDDFSKIDLAFFNINSYISIALFAGVLGAIVLH